MALYTVAGLPPIPLLWAIGSETASNAMKPGDVHLPGYGSCDEPRWLSPLELWPPSPVR
jgi:hypothetical protein